MPRFKLKRRKKEREVNDKTEPDETPPPQPRWSASMASGEPNYKIILCGEYGVGKSSIFRRFLNDTFTSDGSAKASIGLDQCSRSFTVGKTPVKLTMWDTGGMERMSFIGASYYRGANAALLCYNTNSKDTFSILSQYILDIAMNAEGAKIFVCGNDAVSDGKEPVQEADMEAFMSECGDMLSGVYTISCKHNTGLDDMFQDMASVLHKDALSRLTLPRDMIRPSEAEQPQEKKSCC